IKLKNFLGIDNSVSSAEKLASTLGGFVGIFLISWISFYFTGMSGAALIVPSMGASAVLVFAVPHGKLSQPWALFGGHLISAFIGVLCYQLVPDLFLAASLAVGLAIGAMHIFNCIHPPGGATALAAVIGGSAINSLGFEYMLTPVLLNTIVIFLTAVVFNSFFPWRRYPTSMMRFTDTPTIEHKKPSRYIDKEHIERALSDIDLVIDLSVDDLQQLFALTLEHAETPQFSPRQIKLGHYYTNSKHGAEWSVRQIIDEAISDDPKKDMVIYRVVEGQGLQSADSCTRSEFAHWAVREIFPRHS
ncbi:MAG: HPP family protein, partial [Gammaproteobacteria bacterium]|nr:HPP family protein [Gammaproteobacteria bacterium]